MAFLRRERVYQQGEFVGSITAPASITPKKEPYSAVKIYRDAHNPGMYSITSRQGSGETVMLTEDELKRAQERGITHAEYYIFSHRSKH